MNLETKEVLTLSEVSTYTGLSKSHIYKLCSNGGIPFFKPFGKVNYFDRLEIISWLKQNRIATKSELENIMLSDNGKAKEIESKKLTSLQQNVNDGKEGKSAISIETSKLETSKNGGSK
jgi:excisionase family DNA binding protein